MEERNKKASKIMTQTVKKITSKIEQQTPWSERNPLSCYTTSVLKSNEGYFAISASNTHYQFLDIFFGPISQCILARTAT